MLSVPVVVSRELPCSLGPVNSNRLVGLTTVCKRAAFVVVVAGLVKEEDDWWVEPRIGAMLSTGFFLMLSSLVTKLLNPFFFGVSEVLVPPATDDIIETVVCLSFPSTTD